MRVEGANGSGKTSLLRMLCGLSTPEQGQIRWGDTPISQLGTSYYESLAYLGHTNGIKDELTALENLMLCTHLAGTRLSEAAAGEALQQIGLSGREHLPTKVLSQGQKRRVALARLLLTPRLLWVLDEPMAALDQQALEFVEQMMTEHLAKGGIAVLTTHQHINTPSHSTQYLQLGTSAAIS
jgi:heme exporter protein A